MVSRGFGLALAWAVIVTGCALLGCGAGEACEHRGGQRSDFIYKLPIKTDDGTLCFANKNTLELGFWGGSDMRLKQELALREAFVAAGYTEGPTEKKEESITVTFYGKDQIVNVFLMPTRSTRPSPFKKATMMQFNVLQFKK
ncbi:MAG: hypothetical protein R3B07_27790 [Polyangiaceae bacterium]